MGQVNPVAYYTVNSIVVLEWSVNVHWKFDLLTQVISAVIPWCLWNDARKCELVFWLIFVHFHFNRWQNAKNKALSKDLTQESVTNLDMVVHCLTKRKEPVS